MVMNLLLSSSPGNFGMTQCDCWRRSKLLLLSLGNKSGILIPPPRSNSGCSSIFSTLSNLGSSPNYESARRSTSRKSNWSQKDTAHNTTADCSSHHPASSSTATSFPFLLLWGVFVVERGGRWIHVGAIMGNGIIIMVVVWASLVAFRQQRRWCC